MRTLTESENQMIKRRLEALHLEYLEIYDEVFDHYSSELEKSAPWEFKEKFESLNKAFSWSVVKKMERNLEKNTNQQIARIQWRALTFRDFKNQEILFTLTMAFALVASYFLFRIEGLFISTAVVALVISIMVWRTHGRGISFSLGRTHQRPVACLSKVTIRRLAFLYGTMTWIWLGISNWNSSDPGEIGTVMGFAVCLLFFFYSISLWKASNNYATPKNIIL